MSNETDHDLLTLTCNQEEMGTVMAALNQYITNTRADINDTSRVNTPIMREILEKKIAVAAGILQAADDAGILQQLDMRRVR